jgi:hypothetical protein
VYHGGKRRPRLTQGEVKLCGGQFKRLWHWHWRRSLQE